MADYRIGVKPWQSYSSFSLLGGGQRSDRPMVLLVNHYSGNLVHSMTDFVLAARVTPIYTRTYNHLDVTASGVPRPHGYGFTTTFDACIFAEDLDPATTNVTYKDATGSEYSFTWDSQNSVFVSPVGLKKFTLTWSSANSRYELDDGSHILYFERNTGMTVAYLTRIRQKREYNNDYHALKINRVASGGYPTVQISTVQIHYYNTSGSAWADKTILTPTYKTSTDLIETWVLDDTADGSGYKVYVKYTYDGSDLTDVKWFKQGVSSDTDLDMSTKYVFASNILTHIRNSEDYASGTTATQFYYNSGKIQDVMLKATNSVTPTTTFTYGLTITDPADFMRDDDENHLTRVTDPDGNYWYYELNGDDDDQYDEGKLVRSTDPMFDSSTNKNQVDYDWTSANYQMDTITTGVPGADGDDTNTVVTKFFYNANYDLTVIQDQLGFLTFFDYRKDPWGGTPDYTLQSKVHYIYTQKPNRDDLATVTPGSPSISTVSKDGTGYYYTDGSGTPKRIDLVASEMTYDANNNLTSSKTPLGNDTTFGYNASTGDLSWVRDPRQTDAADTDNQTDYTYNDIYGAVLTVTTAEPTSGAARSTSTTEYNATYTRATKVIRPASTDHYTTYTYDDRFFLTAVKRRTTVTKTSPPPDTTNVDLTVAAYVYDKNGNTKEGYKLLPNLNATEAQYNSDSSSNRFKAQEFTYDGMNRMLTSVVYVTLDRTTREAFTTSYEYDLRSLVTKVTRPGGAYDGIKTDMTYDAAGRIEKTYDPYDTSIVMNWPYTTPTYDKLGNVKTTQRYVYDTSSYVVVRETHFTLDVLSRVTNTERDVTEYDYSTNPPTETAVTLTTETTYDSAGNVRFNYTPEGTAAATEYYTKNEYDDDGRLLKSYQPDVITSGTLSFVNDEREYDKNGNTVKYYDFESVTNSKAWYAETRYDNLNRVVNNRVYNSNTSTTVVDWNEADTVFDLNGNVYRTWGKENGSGTSNATERTYDLWDRLTEIEYPEVTDVNDDPVRYTEASMYNLDGGVNGRTDRNGNVPSTSTYDELGRVIATVVNNGTTNYTYVTFYNDAGKVEHTQAAIGTVVVYTYDAQGRTTQVSRQNDYSSPTVTYTTDYTFNATGELTQVDFPDGGQQKYTYDEIGRRRQTEVLYTTSPSSTYITTSVEFNKNGAAKKYWDGRGNASSTTFGLRGQTLTATDPLSRTTTYTYDKNLRASQVDAPDSKQYRMYYNEAGSTTSRRDYLVANTTYIATSYVYDNNSQVTETTDQNGNVWRKSYDAMGRHISTGTPEVSSTTYTNTKWYDGNGNVVKVTDFKGNDTLYTYNNSNQRTQIDYGGGTTVDFEYNCCRMTGYDDQFGTGAELRYDDFARLIYHMDSQGYLLEYEYDSMNRVTKVTDHTLIETDYTYDLMGRTSTITYDASGANRVTSYTYDGNSNVATATYANGYTSTFTYDAGNRVTQQLIEDTTPTTLERFDYNYSPGGLPSNTYGYSRTDYSTPKTYLIAFDRLNRIKLEKLTEGMFTRYSYEHSYDYAGNRTNLIVSGTWPAARSFVYTYDGMGFLTSITDSATNYSASVTTDANGNIGMIMETIYSGGTPYMVINNFEYDRENRLIAQTIDSNVGISVAHAYDGLGRLVKTSRTVSGPTTTEYHHIRDGLKLVGNVDYTNSNTAPTWTNKPNGLMPVESQQIQTNNSQQYINISDEYSPARVTYHPTTSAAGNTSTNNAKGSYSVINGAVPAKVSASPNPNSEMFYHRNLTINQNTIALSTDRGSLEIAGTNLIYEGSRVKSYLLGRDLNPMGRGDGSLYAQGMFSAGNTRPVPNANPIGGFGNSVNNQINIATGDGTINGKCPEPCKWKDAKFLSPKTYKIGPYIIDCPNKYLIFPCKGTRTDYYKSIKTRRVCAVAETTISARVSYGIEKCSQCPPLGKDHIVNAVFIQHTMYFSCLDHAVFA